MNYDELLQTLGEFGTYQKVQYLLVALVSITSAFHSMNMVFVGPTPDHHCAVIDPPTQWEGLESNQVLIVSIPNTDGDWEQCYMYNTTDVDWESGEYEDWVTCPRTTHKCTDGWWYSQEHYGSTIVGEWDLVCDRASERGIASTIFFAGRLVGAVVSGLLSDKFGRRPIFFVSLAGQVIVGCVAAASPYLWFFYIFYFLQGLFQVSVYLCSYVIGLEVVGPRYRKVAGMLVNVFYALGQMFLTGMAYVIRDWRFIEVAISLAPLVFVSFYWLMSESIRWLLTKGKRNEASEIIFRSAKMNKVTLPKDVVDQLEVEEAGVSYTVLDTLKKWSFAKIAINVWFSWMINALVYYGLSLNTSNLHGDPYMNFFIAACVEIPGLIVGLLLLDVVGRRWLMFAFMLLGGIGCLSSAFTEEAVAMWMSMVGKFAITASYSIIYIMAAEVFPTVIRNSGLGVASMCARIGGMIAPQFLVLGDFYEPLPLLLFGVLSIIGGALCLWLPETKGKPLPQNFREVKVDIQGIALIQDEDEKNAVAYTQQSTENPLGMAEFTKM